MPTREELDEEDRRLRQLRIVVHLALSVIAQTELNLSEAEAMVTAVRVWRCDFSRGKNWRLISSTSLVSADS